MLGKQSRKIFNIKTLVTTLGFIAVTACSDDEYQDLSLGEEKIANNDGSLQLNKELLTRLSAEVKRIRASIVE